MAAETTTTALPLAGQHALVTGGGTGIGRAIAAALTASGALVSVVGRREGPLQDAVATGHAAFAVSADVTDEAEIRNALATVARAHGPILVLVNAAGAAETAPFQKTTVAMFERMWRVNVGGAVTAIQAALPGMLQAGFGRIVNIASTASLKGYRYVSAYVAAKHGLLGSDPSAGTGSRRYRRYGQCRVSRLHRHRPGCPERRSHRRPHPPLRDRNPCNVHRNQPARAADSTRGSGCQCPVSLPAWSGRGEWPGTGG